MTLRAAAIVVVGAAIASSAGAQPTAVYYLGTAFADLELSYAHKGRSPTFIYGTCDPRPHGCSPPLQVQNWALAERHPRRFGAGIRCVRGTIKQRPAAVFASTGGIELYAGRTVVVLFGHPAERVMRATRAVRWTRSRRAPARLAVPPASVTTTLATRCHRGDLLKALKAGG
jgi:hypothetical protein